MSDSNDWSHGYPVGEAYPASWHGFQSPAHLRAICALMGVVWEVGPDKPMCIAEVGCGTGYTALVLAAGNPGSQVIGLDYNPAHIAEARSMAAAAGLDNVTLFEVDLAQMDERMLDALHITNVRLYQGDLLQAVTAALRQVEGTFGNAVLAEAHPGRLVAALTHVFGIGRLQLAEDVVQDAYVKAYQALTSGRFERR